MAQCGEGALQTRGTCWFFSIINGFLLSDAGQKILFDHLEKFYKSLSVAERAQFDDGVPPPCVKSLMTAKRMYFYKFLDQYLCFRSGPRSMSLRAGKSANVLGAVRLAGTVARQEAGGKGGRPSDELPVILKHLGIKDYLIANPFAELAPTDAKKRPHFVVTMDPKTGGFEFIIKFRPDTYSLMCCSITIGNTKAPNTAQHRWHAITGFVCNGKGYLFDSNQRDKMFPCNWWDWYELEKVVYGEVARYYDHFAGGQITKMVYSFVIFSRNDYINSIKPVCRLKYKNAKLGGNTYTVNNYAKNKNFVAKVEKGFWPHLKPANIAAIKRRMGQAPVISKNFYNSLLKTATNRTSAMQAIRNMKNKGYRINKNAQLEFLQKLGNKFKSTTERTSPNRYLNALKNINALKTAKARAEWLKAKKLNFSKERMKGLRNYVKQKNQANRNRRAEKRVKPRSPSPVNPNIYLNINALKTAKARAEFLKAKKLNFTKEQMKELRNYVKAKNQANRNRRAAKRLKA